MMIRPLVFGILAVAASTASAADSRHVLAGMGSLACEDWHTVRARNDSMLNNIAYSWVQGFFSALSTMRLQAGDQAVPAIPQSEELLKLVDAGCVESPHLPVFAVAMRIYVKQPLVARKDT